MGASPRAHAVAPSRRAALAGVIAASFLLAALTVAVVWDRPARVPTYPASEWSGASDTFDQGVVGVDVRGAFTACPTLWLPDGTTAGMLLVDGWTATIPGLGWAEPRSPALIPGPEVDVALSLDGSYVPPVEGRVLDPAVGDDAVLADRWIGACGAADAVVMVAPDAVVQGPTVAP